MTTERTDNSGMTAAHDDDEFIKLTKVKAHVSHSKTGKLEQVREHMDSRAAAAEKSATGIAAGKGVFQGPARLPAKSPIGESRSIPRTDGRIGQAHPTARSNEVVEGGKVVGVRRLDGSIRRAGDPIIAPKKSYPSSPVRKVGDLGHDGAKIKAAGSPGASLEEARKAGIQEVKKPLSDEEYAKHTAHVEATMVKHVEAGHTTDVLHGHGRTPEERRKNAEAGIYSPERAAVHKQIVDEVYNRQKDRAKSEGKALITGGLGGAGKSTVLKHHAGIDTKDYVVANPDDMKEELAKRDLIPKAGDLSPMERAGLVHEESSHLANLLAERAYKDKKNIAWDVTMSKTSSVQRRLDEIHANGYKHTKGVFVDIPVEHSVTRALQRHRRGMEEHRNGHGMGGRYVSPTVIRANKSDKSSSANREVFDGLKHKFDSWDVYDNSGSEGNTKKVSSSEDKIDKPGPKSK